MYFLSSIPKSVFVVSVVLALALLGDAMIYAVLPASVENFGLTVGFVGVLLSVNRFIRVISNPLAAVVYDRIGLNKPMVIAILLAVGSTAAYGLFKSFWPLLVARLLWGISFSFLRLGGYLVILEEGSPSVRGQLMGFFSAIQRSGNLVGVILGAVLADLIGHRSTFLLFAVVTSFGIPLILSRRLSSYTGKSGKRSEPIESVGATHEKFMQREQDLEDQSSPVLYLLIRWRLYALYFIRFTIGFSVSGLVMSTLGLHLRSLEGDSIQIFGLSLGVATLTGLLLGSRWAFALGLATYLGILSDRIGRRKIILGFSLLLAFVLVILGTYPIFFLVALVLPVLFLASIACEVSLDASVGDLAHPAFRSRALGWYTTWTDLGMAIGPLLGYGLTTVWGLESVYLLASGLLGSGIATYYFVREGEPSR
jgi:MFS family permease